MSGASKNQNVPVEFHIEQEAFAKDGDFEVTYKACVNQIEMEEKYMITRMREKLDNSLFVKTLQKSSK